MYPPPFERGVKALRNLPGVGEKSAIRYAISLVRGKPEKLQELIAGLTALQQELGACPQCGFMSTPNQLCVICSSTKRDLSLCCVVASGSDLEAVEKSGAYNGLYYILGLALDPQRNYEQFKEAAGKLVQAMLKRQVAEVILALNPDFEGEATMSYLHKALQASGIKSSRLAVGIPVAGEIEFAGPTTVSLAIRHRQAFAD